MTVLLRQPIIMAKRPTIESGRTPGTTSSRTEYSQLAPLSANLRIPAGAVSVSGCSGAVTVAANYHD